MNYYKQRRGKSWSRLLGEGPQSDWIVRWCEGGGGEVSGCRTALEEFLRRGCLFIWRRLGKKSIERWDVKSGNGGRYCRNC